MNRCVIHPNCIATMLCLHQKCKYQPFLCSACVDENLHKDHQYLSAVKFKKEIEALLLKYEKQNPMEQQRQFKQVFDSIIEQVDQFREFLVQNYYQSLDTLKQTYNNKQKQLVVLHQFVKNNVQEEDIIKQATKVLEFVELIQSNSKQELCFKNEEDLNEDPNSFNTLFFNNAENKQDTIHSFFNTLRNQLEENIHYLQKKDIQKVESFQEYNFSIENYDPLYLLKTHIIQKEQEKAKEKEPREVKSTYKPKSKAQEDDEYKPAAHLIPGSPKRRGRPPLNKNKLAEKDLPKGQKKQIKVEEKTNGIAQNESLKHSVVDSKATK